MLDKYSCTRRDGRGDCKATRRASQCGKNTEHRRVSTLLLDKELSCRNSTWCERHRKESRVILLLQKHRTLGPLRTQTRENLVLNSVAAYTGILLGVGFLMEWFE